MIQKIELTDKSIEEFTRQFLAKGSGKVLSCAVKLERGVDISITTELGEEILNVSDDGVYYPRVDVSSKKDKDGPLTGEVQTIDYFYFTGSLLIELNAEGEMGGKLALNELIILYDDMQ